MFVEIINKNMKKLLAIFIVLMCVMSFNSCSKDEELNPISTYRLKVTTNPKETYLILTYEGVGGNNRYEIEGNSEIEIKQRKHHSTQINVLVSNNPDNKVKSPYIKLELFKGKKLIASKEGSSFVQLSH